MKAEQKKNNIIFYGCIAVCFCTIFVLNLLTPLGADDYGYASSENLVEVFMNEYHQYLGWTGRSVAHVLARIFLMLPKMIFNFCNSIVYVILSILIYLHAGGGINKKKVTLYLLINCCMWVFFPEFGQTVLWVTGSCNYLWCSVIILSFLLPYRINFSEPAKEMKCSYICSFIMLLLGILAGWGNENTSGGCILMVIIFLFLQKYKKKKISLWMVTGLVGTIIGYLIMLCAPGNAIRSQYFIDERSFPIKLLGKFGELTQFIREEWIVLLIIFICLISIQIFNTNLMEEKISIWLTLSYGVVAFAIVYALILSPNIGSGRAKFGGTIFMIIGVASAFAHIKSTRKEWKITVSILLSLLSMVVIFTAVPAVKDIVGYKIRYEEREAYVEEQKQLGNLNPIVPVIEPQPESKYNARHRLEDLNKDVNHWINRPYAREHGLETVRSVSYSEWEQLYKNAQVRLTSCTDIYEYFGMLNQNNYLVIMSVNGGFLAEDDETLYQLLDTLGLNKNLLEKEHYGYGNVISNGEVLFEEAGYTQVMYENMIDELAISVISNGKYHNGGGKSSIQINGIEYSRNKVGINIVVYDLEKECMADSVAFIVENDAILSVR